MVYNFASRVSRMQSSAIREILKVTEKPEVISFAGGLPAPELFPAAEIKEAFNRALAEDHDSSSLQYSTTEGFTPLREYIAREMTNRGIKAEPDQVLITSGSQQALDLIFKLFIDPGDVVLVENPTYLGALQVMDSYQANIVAVASDSDGVNLEALEAAIVKYLPKLVYLVPTFKNPTGETMRLERRRQLAAILARHQVILLEDDPYEALRYDGHPVPPIKSFDEANRVIYLSTFSKTVAPGLRLGWVIAEEKLITKLVLAKQCADLHTNSLAQRAVYQYLLHSDVQAHIETIRDAYGQRKDAMIAAMREYFPSGVKWTEPEGGMFLWVTLSEEVDTQDLLEEAVKKNVAFVPGTPFFPDGGVKNCMRLNFSNSTPEQIRTGIERLGRLLNEYL